MNLYFQRHWKFGDGLRTVKCLEWTKFGIKKNSKPVLLRLLNVFATVPLSTVKRDDHAVNCHVSTAIAQIKWDRRKKIEQAAQYYIISFMKARRLGELV